MYVQRTPQPQDLGRPRKSDQTLGVRVRFAESICRFPCLKDTVARVALEIEELCCDAGDAKRRSASTLLLLGRYPVLGSLPKECIQVLSNTSGNRCSVTGLRAAGGRGGGEAAGGK